MESNDYSRCNKFLTLLFSKRRGGTVSILVTVLALVGCSGGSDEALTPVGPSAQSFVGTVSCDTLADTPQSQLQSQVLETRVVLDRAVWQNGSIPGAFAAPAILTGGFAGLLVGGGQTQMTVGIPELAPTGNAQLSFEVSVDSVSGTHRETGEWTVLEDGNGRATLQGNSTAVLDSGSAVCSWNLSAATGPAGPLSLEHVGSLGAPEQTLAPAVTLGTTGTDCGKVFSTTTTGLFIASGLVYFVPPLSAALRVSGVVTGIAGGAGSSACLSANFAGINEQLAIMSQNILAIEVFLGLATNKYYQDFYELQVKDATSALATWKAQVDVISPSTNSGPTGGIFGNWMGSSGVGFWDSSGEPIPGVDVQNIALDDAIYAQLQVQIISANSDFKNALPTITGTQYTNPGASCSPGCYAMIGQAGVFNDLIISYQDLFDVFQADIDIFMPNDKQFITPQHQNIVPLFDQYNEILVSVYQQAIVTLQQAFTIEQMINQINYTRGQNSKSDKQLAQMGAVPDTYYSYIDLQDKSQQGQEAAFKEKQINLFKLYAAIANQLYLNTLNFVVSDVPVAPQAYPTGTVDYPPDCTTDPNTDCAPGPDYATEVGKNLQTRATNGVGVTPLSLVPAQADGGWKSNAVLYQFSGLSDAATCINTLIACQKSGSCDTVDDWAANSTQNCPPILTVNDDKVTAFNQGTCTPDTSTNPEDCTGSAYDGNTLKPYTSFDAILTTTGNPLVVAGLMKDNLKYCDYATPSLGWFAPGTQRPSNLDNDAGLVAGETYLNCGNWYEPRYDSGLTCTYSLPRTNCPYATSLTAPYRWNPDGTKMPAPETVNSWQTIALAVTNESATKDTCSDFGKQDLNGNKYAWYSEFYSDTNLTELVTKSTYSFVIDKLVQDEDFKDARFEPTTGSYQPPASTLAYRIGWIDDGNLFKFRIPDSPDNKKVSEFISFGIRMWNVTDSGKLPLANTLLGGDQIAKSLETSGWTMPMNLGIGCFPSDSGGRYVKMEARIPPKDSEGKEWGISCTGPTGTQTVGQSMTCTIPDGTAYEISLSRGTSIIPGLYVNLAN